MWEVGSCIRTTRGSVPVFSTMRWAPSHTGSEGEQVKCQKTLLHFLRIKISVPYSSLTSIIVSRLRKMDLASAKQAGALIQLYRSIGDPDTRGKTVRKRPSSSPSVQTMVSPDLILFLLSHLVQALTYPGSGFRCNLSRLALSSFRTSVSV